MSTTKVTSNGAQNPSRFSRALRSGGSWLTSTIPVSIISALFIGALFMVIAGVNPLDGYSAMVQGSLGSGMGLSSMLQRAIPIIGLGIAIAIAFRAGVLNLGTEGQAGLGALAGGMVAVYVPGPGALIAILAVTTAVIVGALWGLLAGVMQTWLGVPILLSTLLLNYPARYFSSWMIRYQLDEPSSELIASEQIDPSRQLPMLISRDGAFAETLRNTFGSTSPLPVILTGVNWSLVIVALLVFGAWFMNRRTVFGFEAGLAGQNPEFTRYSGVKPAPLVLRTMALSGGIAGLIGVLIIVGAPNVRLIEGQIVQSNFAWTALLVTLLALYRPVGVAIAGLFFAAIMVGSDAMGRELSMSPQISAIIQALVIILLAYKLSLPKIGRKTVTQSKDEKPGGSDPTADTGDPQDPPQPPTYDSTQSATEQPAQTTTNTAGADR